MNYKSSPWTNEAKVYRSVTCFFIHPTAFFKNKQTKQTKPTTWNNHQICLFKFSYVGNWLQVWSPEPLGVRKGWIVMCGWGASKWRTQTDFPVRLHRCIYKSYIILYHCISSMQYESTASPGLQGIVYSNIVYATQMSQISYTKYPVDVISLPDILLQTSNSPGPSFTATSLKPHGLKLF